MEKKLKKPVGYNGVYFYPAATEGKSEAQFLEEQAHVGLTPEELKDAYAKLTAKPVEEPKKKGKQEDENK